MRFDCVVKQIKGPRRSRWPDNFVCNLWLCNNNSLIHLQTQICRPDHQRWHHGSRGGAPKTSGRQDPWILLLSCAFCGSEYIRDEQHRALLGKECIVFSVCPVKCLRTKRCSKIKRYRKCTISSPEYVFGEKKIRNEYRILCLYFNWFLLWRCWFEKYVSGLNTKLILR